MSIMIAQYFPRADFLDINSATLPQLYASGSLAGSVSNSSLIAGVTGKQIRVLSANFYSAGGQTAIIIKTSGLAYQRAFVIADVATAGKDVNLVLPTDPTGWLDTASGEGLVASTGAVGVVWSIKYVMFTA